MRKKGMREWTYGSMNSWSRHYMESGQLYTPAIMQVLPIREVAKQTQISICIPWKRKWNPKVSGIELVV